MNIFRQKCLFLRQNRFGWFAAAGVGSHARKSEVSRPDTITKTFFGVLLSVANSFQDNPARL